MKNLTVNKTNGQTLVEVSGIASELYGTTTAAGTAQQAIELGFLSCGDGQNHKLNWQEKSQIMMSGTIIEVTEERYFEMLEVLPPMYLQNFDGFAVTEAQTHIKTGAVYSIYWKEGEKFFHAWATLTANGKPVFDSGQHEYKKVIATILQTN